MGAPRMVQPWPGPRPQGSDAASRPGDHEQQDAGAQENQGPAQRRAGVGARRADPASSRRVRRLHRPHPDRVGGAARAAVAAGRGRRGQVDDVGPLGARPHGHPEADLHGAAHRDRRNGPDDGVAVQDQFGRERDDDGRVAQHVAQVVLGGGSGDDSAALVLHDEGVGDGRPGIDDRARRWMGHPPAVHSTSWSSSQLGPTTSALTARTRSASSRSAVTTITARWPRRWRRSCRRPRRAHAQPRRRPRRLVGSRPGSALEHEGHGRVQPSGGHRCPHSFREPSCRAWPVAPPAGWPRPDHVGGVDHQHPNSVAPSHIARTAPHRTGFDV